MNFKELLKTKDYDFLRTNPRLGDNILFLCVGGSHSYGTNVETSDVDVRGVALNNKTDLLGLTSFEQYIDEKTDTTIYGLNKFIKLVSGCNPNIIEMLFCNPEHYLYVSPFGQLLLNNRHLFLTKRAYYTFTGYANAQLSKVENALAGKGKLSDELTMNHIKRSVEGMINTFNDKFGLPENSMSVKTQYNDLSGEYELTTNVNLKNYNVSQLVSVMTEIDQAMKDYKNSLGRHNTKKDDAKLNKHMMHLVRLYEMSIEILSTRKLSTFRGKNLPVLMAIRRGLYRNTDGTLTNEYLTLVETLRQRSKRAFETSTLPKSVNAKAVTKLVLSLYTDVFKDVNI